MYGPNDTGVERSWMAREDEDAVTTGDGTRRFDEGVTGRADAEVVSEKEDMTVQTRRLVMIRGHWEFQEQRATIDLCMLQREASSNK